MTKAARAVALLDWLATQPNGACKIEIPDGQFSDASTVLRRFCERGQVGFVREPGMKAGNPRRRYFVRDQCPPGATLAPLKIPRRAQLAADPTHVPQPRHKQQALTVIKPAAIKFSDCAADYSRAKLTVWVPPPDPRDRYLPSEPLFGSIDKGRRPSGDTAIARAYK